MTLVRTAVAAAVGVSLVLAGSAGAAPKKKKVPPVCNLITDDKGDSGYVVLPNSDALDIVSADVASDGTTLSAVIRVAKYTANEPQTFHGKRYIVAFEGAGLKPMYLTLLDWPAGQSFNFGSTSPSATGGTTYTSDGVATGVVDAAAGTITMSVKAAELATAGYGKLSKGKDLSNINAVTFRRVGTSLQPGDEATTSKKYKVGALSCLKP